MHIFYLQIVSSLISNMVKWNWMLWWILKSDLYYGTQSKSISRPNKKISLCSHSSICIIKFESLFSKLLLQVLFSSNFRSVQLIKSCKKFTLSLSIPQLVGSQIFHLDGMHFREIWDAKMTFTWTYHTWMNKLDINLQIMCICFGTIFKI